MLTDEEKETVRMIRAICASLFGDAAVNEIPDQEYLNLDKKVMDSAKYKMRCWIELERWRAFARFVQGASGG